MRKVIFILPVLLFVVLAFVLWQGLAPKHQQEVQQLPSALIGKDVPSFNLPDFFDANIIINPAEFSGQAYIINYFASWCVPCRAEHPLLKELTAESGLPILGILYKDKRDAAEAFLKELGNPYKAIAFDEEGRQGIEFGLYGIPETFIIDKEGKIRFRHAGPLDSKIIQEEILPLLKDLQK